MNIDEFLPENNCRLFLDGPYNFYGHKTLFYEFDDVIFSKGFFCDEKIKPLAQTLDEHVFWNPKCISGLPIGELNKEANFRKKNIEKEVPSSISKVKYLQGQYIDLTHPFGRYAFGHIFDSLQRLFAIPESIISDKTVKFLIGDCSLICEFTEHLSALCKRKIQEKDLVLCNKNEVYKIQRLYFGINPAPATTFSRDSYKWIIERYYNYFGIDKIENAYKIYCNRNHVRLGRGVINNEEVINFLSKKGFVVLNGNESLKEIVNHFAKADVIIGAHGSLLANSMFSGPNAKVIEFCPKTRIDRSFLLKLKMAKNYKQIILESDAAHNVVIPIEELEKHTS
jgi:hypothetical protein